MKKTVEKNLEEIFSQNPIWLKVSDILNECHKKGFFSVIAGGAVRDALLGKIPKDFDIATEAHPDQLTSVFKHTKLVGKSFGVLLIPLSKTHNVEIATFRTDGVYKDGRRPESVEFTTIEQDALRRDFTMNALYYDIQKKEVIDYVDGLSDIQKKLIRTVGNPEHRFKEDKLRLLRALRFALTFDFKIEEKTLLMIQKFMPDISQLARERILDEIKKVFRTGKFKHMMQLFHETQVFQYLWKNWPYPDSAHRQLWSIIPLLKDKPELHWWIYILTPYVWMKNSFLKQVNLDFSQSFQELKKTLMKSLKNMELYNNIKLPKEKEQQLTGFYLFYLEMMSQSHQENELLNRGKKLYLLSQNPSYLEPLKVLVADNESFCKEVQSVEKEWNKKFPNARLPEPLLTGHDLLQIPIEEKMRSHFMKYIRIQQLIDPSLDKASALQMAQSVDRSTLSHFEWF